MGWQPATRNGRLIWNFDRQHHAIQNYDRALREARNAGGPLERLNGLEIVLADAPPSSRRLGVPQPVRRARQQAH